MKKDIKNKKISPFYNNLQHFVQNLKIYLYPYLKKKKEKKRQAELFDKTEIFSQRYNPSIVEKSAPTLGKQRTTKCSVDEGIKRKINIPSRDKLEDGIRVKSSPTPPKASSFDPSRTPMDRRTDSRARFSNISSIDARFIDAITISHRRNTTIDKTAARARANYLSNKFSLKKKEKEKRRNKIDSSFPLHGSQLTVNRTTTSFEENCSFLLFLLPLFFFLSLYRHSNEQGEAFRGSTSRAIRSWEAIEERSVCRGPSLDAEEFSCGYRGAARGEITTLIFDSLITLG